MISHEMAISLAFYFGNIRSSLSLYCWALLSSLLRFLHYSFAFLRDFSSLLCPCFHFTSAFSIRDLPFVYLGVLLRLSLCLISAGGLISSPVFIWVLILKSRHLPHLRFLFSSACYSCGADNVIYIHLSPFLRSLLACPCRSCVFFGFFWRLLSIYWRLLLLLPLHFLHSHEGILEEDSMEVIQVLGLTIIRA